MQEKQVVPHVFTQILLLHPTHSTQGEADRLTLLIVDDEEGPRQSLRVVFRQEYEVLVACDAVEAIIQARERNVHVAVVDIMMEGLSGLDLLRELKECNPTTEVIILTAFETLETARQALRYGACDYLTKPFDVATMREAVGRAAERHRLAAHSARSQEQLVSLQHEFRDQRLREEMARTKGEIYASVLHDINSPLTVIAGFVELINRSIDDTSRVEGEELESLKDDLRNITGQVDRCFEISRRYLSFLGSGRVDPDNITSVRQILADVKELLLRHPSARGHQLVVRDGDEDLLAAINGTDLLQILLNLTINALHASDDPHRVTLEANLLEDGLDISGLSDSPVERFINRDAFVKPRPLVAITVRDNGRGIAPEIVARMFEEQFTTKATGQGTGLGLSIVRRLVVHAEGGVHLQTVFGHGTEFTVLVPAGTSPASATPPPGASEQVASAR